ncbi:MAG TPA: RDD family protein [Candidatus Polarisedimenticolia bacterium]|nr:RDD family protein [Candidatus Polarisedimenticolia bacterium]
MYCSKCGVSMDGGAFCSNCGQAFAVATMPSHSPALATSFAAPVGGSEAPIPAYAGYAAQARVEYAGFWPRFLALLIDNVVMGIGFVLVLIPLIFLTGLGGFLSQIHPDEELNDAGIFVLIGLIFLAATVSLVFTWLYHALMESSEWQATVGKKALGLVVTDMAGQRVSFARSTGRHFGKIITNMVPFFIGYIMAGFTAKKQALHDMLAGCLVLRRNG